MKKVSIFIATAMMSGMFLASCGGGEAPKTETPEEEVSAEDLLGEEAPAGDAMEMPVDPAGSTIQWTGSVIGGYSHTGTINISEGTLSMENDMLSGGSFTIDMTTIVPTDENYGEGHTKEDLVGHLGTGDFFDVAANPVATFVITGVDMETSTISGDLTLKGVTNAEILTDVVLDKEAGAASGKMVINRQTYGVSYVSTMKDMVVSDDISLAILVKLAM